MKLKLFLIFVILIFSPSCAIKGKTEDFRKSFGVTQKNSEKISQLGNSCFITAVLTQANLKKTGIDSRVLTINYNNNISHAVLFIKKEGKMIVFDDHWGAVEMLSASESKVPQEWSALYGVPGYPKKISSYAFID